MDCDGAVAGNTRKRPFGAIEGDAAVPSAAPSGPAAKATRPPADQLARGGTMDIDTAAPHQALDAGGSAAAAAETDQPAPMMHVDDDAAAPADAASAGATARTVDSNAAAPAAATAAASAPPTRKATKRTRAAGGGGDAVATRATETAKQSCWDPPAGTPDPKDAPALGSYHKYYAVAAGRQTGVFDSWPKAWALTHQWPLNRFAGFDDMATAEAFVKKPWKVGKSRSRSAAARTKGAAASARRHAAAAAAPAQSTGTVAQAAGAASQSTDRPVAGAADAATQPAGNSDTRYLVVNAPPVLQADLDALGLPLE